LPPRIRPMSSRKFVRLLERHDVVFVRQQGTSHAIFERVTQERTWRAPVIMGKSELSAQYIRLVLRQLGFTSTEIDKIFEQNIA
jgi:predicted RNA binding protein YcfA (HicA-like mRNA interferase family)